VPLPVQFSLFFAKVEVPAPNGEGEAWPVPISKKCRYFAGGTPAALASDFERLKITDVRIACSTKQAIVALDECASHHPSK
jgi:hypothetical protein